MQILSTDMHLNFSFALGFTKPKNLGIFWGSKFALKESKPVV